MRPSNRTKILEAAIRVIHREGVTGVTFDSVAAEAEITRGGMMYHFRSREALIEAIHQHLAQQWEDSMVESLGKPILEATPRERFTAYIQACAQSATRAELLFMLDSSTQPELSAPWTAILEKWAPPPPQKKSNPEDLACFIARLAADGLWAYESLSNTSLDPELRRKVLKELARMVQRE